MQDTAHTEFVLDAALDAEIARATDALRESRHVVALTGAGLSVESGIPPFRGPGGLWTQYGEPPMDGYQRFLADPAAAWREQLNPTAPWAVGLAETLAAAKPNAGHAALAELERRGACAAVITQNIDDLQRQAGSQVLLEIHGNAHWLRCSGCNQRFDRDELEVDPERLPPHCPSCEGIVKGDTVQFGEPIPPDVLDGCFAQVALADCMLVVGTSTTVYPAAGFPLEVLHRGGCAIEVNPEETEFSRLATHSLRGPAGAVLTRILDHVAGAEATR